MGITRMTKSRTRWLGLLSITVVAFSTILPQAQAVNLQKAAPKTVKAGAVCTKAGAVAKINSTYNAVCKKNGSKLTWAKAPLKEIVLGALDDLTGPAAAIGTLAEKSVKIGVAAMNKAGGMNGYKIKLVFYDNKSDPATTATLGMRLITQDKAVAIICCASSSTVAALSAIAGRYKVPVLGVSQQQDLTSPLQSWYGYLFRIAPDNNTLALYNTNFAFSKGWKKIALAT
jgi:ABC-type branched-subunit amino acid transport system substrate-binding protein